MESQQQDNCNDQEFIICNVCSIKLPKKYLGERCPRCNSVVFPNACQNCKNHCK